MGRQEKLNTCGIYTWFGFMMPFREKLRLIKDAGFNTVCTWWDDMFSETDGRKEEQFDQTLSAGLFIEHTHLPYFGCDELWRPGLNGDALCAQYCRAVAGATASGIRTIVMHPFERQVPLGGDWAVFITRMERIAKESAKRKSRLAVENICDQMGIMRILDHFSGAAHVGLCFDTGHNYLAAVNDFSLLDRYWDRVFALHVHDNNGKTDEHLLPYEGSIDWNTFMEKIRKTDFAGSLMLESCYPIDVAKLDMAHGYQAPSVPPEEYLAWAKQSCEKVLRAGI